MALDRWIALVLLGICLIYGYTAWFTMDDALAPFMRRNPVWPSTFPKLLSILGIVASVVLVLGVERREQSDSDDIDYRRLGDYQLTSALLLLGLMVAYALLLRPLGFLISTTAFLMLGAVILGERKWHVLIPVAVAATLLVWYLVQQVLGIFLSPLPAFAGA